MSLVTRHQAALRSLVFALFAVLTTPVLSADFSVNPLRAELSANQRIVAFNVGNSGSKPLSIQAELMAWNQLDGKDHYEPSRELLATPPIFTLPPGESQVVRVGLRRPPERDRELAYRLFLQELPAPTPEGFQGLRMVTRMSLPVFVAPAAGEANHELDWKVRLEAGQLHLSARNTGNGHARITALRIASAGQSLDRQVNTYVLPGAKARWAIPLQKAPRPFGATLDVVARINGSESHFTLTLSE